jgi:SAM-dependent methyltransferase
MNKLLRLFSHWIHPIVPPLNIVYFIPHYLSYFSDLAKYSRMRGSEKISIMNTWPIIHDKMPSHPLNAHYFYQSCWAFDKIMASGVKKHVDVASSVEFIGLLSRVVPVEFVDIRPLEADLKGLTCKSGSILSLPYPDNSIESLSCMHVAEHIGLGRYGDPLDPLGTKKAAAELSRVLAPGGKLYFSIPLGKPRVCFNAHRVHDSKMILDYFPGLELAEFSGIDDSGKHLQNIKADAFDGADFACGLFLFKKPKK